MLSSLWKVLFLFVAASLSISSYAGDREASGTVRIYANSGKIIIKLSGSNKSCGNRYFFDLNSEYNKAMFSLLLAAQVSDKRVWVNGTGDCISTYPYSNAYRLVNMTIID
ncbi:hypothetical protein SOPP22_01500 [Shewanella sp. OPT22]|nr:hypothetical protein SOPP22_01500 [Shewanella sp. OPT22]